MDQSIEIIYPRPNAAVASFSGEYDMSTKPDTTALLNKLVGDYEVVVIDLRETTFFDSSFLHCLVLANKCTGQVRLVVSDTARKTLEISGLSKVFTLSPTREDALSVS